MLTYQTLIDDLRRGCKPKSAFKIGLEHEQFLSVAHSGKPVPYDGDIPPPPNHHMPTIRAFLEMLAGQGHGKLIYENGLPIGLNHNEYSISLEPGGQFEFSGAPCATLTGAKAEMDKFYQSLEPLAEQAGIKIIRCGFHPDWRRDDIKWVPKERYGIMRPYMQKKGQLGLDMMGRTCGAQVNLDFDSEEDMIRKFRVAAALQPVIIALMSSSAIVEGKQSGYDCYRAHIWTDTDPDRCGFLPFIFDDDMSFARYVDYALDVPMYFIRRGAHYIDVSGRSFRDFMAGRLPGHHGEYPDIKDWHDHLSTLFPVVRLKTYLELRGPDSGPPALVYAMAAFWAGLLYDEGTLEHCHHMVCAWPRALHGTLDHSVPRTGLNTPLPGTDWPQLGDLAAYLLEKAATGLHRQGQNSAWLTPLHTRLPRLKKHVF